jgi:hypothetical protein
MKRRSSLKLKSWTTVADALDNGRHMPPDGRNSLAKEPKVIDAEHSNAALLYHLPAPFLAACCRRTCLPNHEALPSESL